MLQTRTSPRRLDYDNRIGDMNMNGKIIFCLAIAIFFSFAHAAAAVTDEDMQNILEKLEALSKENQEIKNQNKQLLNRITVLEQKKTARNDIIIEELTEEVEGISELIEVLDKKTMMDRISINAELRTRADWFHFRNENINEEISGRFSNRFRLNLKSKIMKNLFFHGRLTMYRDWNDAVEGDGIGEERSWFNLARTRGNTELEVERAYVDYFFTLIDKLPMALTFGRLPLTDGLPTELRENTTRKSTYPGLAFDAEIDGIALSVDLSQVTGLPASALRFVYLKESSTSNPHYRKPELDYDVLDMLTLQFETQIPKLIDSLFITNFLYVPEVTAISLEEREGLRAIDLPRDLGSFYKLTFFVQTSKFLGSWFDLFAGYSYMRTDAEDPSIWGIGRFPVVGLGLLNWEGNSDRNADCYYFGTRINLPIPGLNNPKLGIEFNRGSKYWVGLNPASEDPLHKLDIRGKVWDFYYIQPINKKFMIRFGHTYIDVDHDALMWYGVPDNKDEKIKNTYILLDAKF